MMILPLIIFVIILVWAFNSQSTMKIVNIRNKGESNALEILNHRFVSGEISEEEYLRKKNILMNSR
ncbi:SHOCT domain-containing protein [Clostridium thailandense]|uniref:SHOCT domain-containing protein n=1 Tax=Clostridium thailandense TaxID=2794346 RepID=UPI003989AE62